MKIEIGGTYNSLNYGKFKVINKIKNDLYQIQFINTLFCTNAYFSAITNGQVKDNLIPTVNNIGCLGYSTKKGNEKCYRLWKGMLERCYNPNNYDYKYYGARKVTVCERWYRFDYFLEDITNIEGYDHVLFWNNELELDKDIKQYNREDKVYSKETCCFVKKNNNIMYRKFSLQKEFIATSPDGKIYNSKSIREFSRNHNLVATHISRCLNGKADKHKGWKFRYLESEVLN